MRVDTNGPDAVNDACVLSVRLEVVDGGKLEEYHVEIHRRRCSSSINADAGRDLPSADTSPCPNQKFRGWWLSRRTRIA
jgi:hypothetical protein